MLMLMLQQQTGHSREGAAWYINLGMGVCRGGHGGGEDRVASSQRRE